MFVHILTMNSKKGRKKRKIMISTKRKQMKWKILDTSQHNKKNEEIKRIEMKWIEIINKHSKNKLKE